MRPRSLETGTIRASETATSLQSLRSTRRSHLIERRREMPFTRATGSAAVLVVIALLTPCVPASADPVVWNGPMITFTKPDFSDWTLPVNQDRLTDNVWLTRADINPLFNIAVDPFYMEGSPS